MLMLVGSVYRGQVFLKSGAAGSSWQYGKLKGLPFVITFRSVLGNRGGLGAASLL